MTIVLEIGSNLQCVLICILFVIGFLSTIKMCLRDCLRRSEIDSWKKVCGSERKT
jgi:hypothetical protein